MHNGTTQNMMSLIVTNCLSVRELIFDLVSLSLTLAGQEVRGFIVSNGYNASLPHPEMREDVFPRPSQTWPRSENQKMWKLSNFENSKKNLDICTHGKSENLD